MQVSYEDLYALTSQYIHKQESQSLMKRAYDLANRLHKGQFRQSGEAYIIHPLSVAIILAELHAGPATICAGLLHDTLEDTNETEEDLAKEFGEDIVSIVDGVTKLEQMTFTTLEQKQAENQQHMLLAMAKDIRVIIVKLADRLHNIRTLGVCSEEKQRRVARETLDIYAPLAHKLGMFQIKAELEDTALKYVEPIAYAKIINQIKTNTSVRLNSIDHTIDEIKAYLEPHHIPQFEIKGRIKNTFSIYKKMINQNKAFEDIYDILAIRIIVDTISECYQVLGIIHAHYTPVPKRFKDYIAVPKPNMYQSLHTTVISSDGLIFEVQIRTVEMDRVAELGIAAHWAYKENVEYSREKEQFEIASKLKWYAELLEYSEEDKNSEAKDFVDTIKEDILTTNVYVYTPTGEVIALPKGATPLDFAYKIHTNIGNKTVGALVNQKIVPLDYELQNGDIISIKTSKSSFGPSENWLKIAKTSSARHKIKSFLNKQNRDVLVANGKASLEEEFRIAKIHLDLDDALIEAQFGKNNIHSVEDLYYEIGKGNISVKTISNRLGEKHGYEENLAKQIERSQKILTTNSETGVVVEGLSNPQLKLGSCCNPIPGDPIMGYVTKGYGIVIHHKNCKNALSFAKERLIPLSWATNPNRKYPVCIKISATTNNNLLVDIMNVVSANGLSILSINATNNQNLQTVVKLKVLTYSLMDLEKMIVNLKKIKFIDNIERDNI
ncbi:MAG: bifunctional (p)ppGpp synthetase/guanosine-3',5'-bis(diphosphate) 3'-pyrophosphohydrolase [Roseburia sp.]|nr:bifunctional (p)ppGpp synthetase/guanosine-3',5'-bis(diphosphate) 3'-pyrophosphohydrolase [Anaeroplasma bactoclasticum]MCM1196181.1 bifunctional (p)ppGpp synthetase/guanosine-3',5'-bis(diphosphate) 3'-pyrophosphohydrolase [Roseburia sp.]MCM1556269.1 bifunctional (p)ppGpp synthetase/guanosine-3',5'-bis(diphosphate) 3'-pyrophosphohydrolase [Anaeroplasma bactoclasticum]